MNNNNNLNVRFSHDNSEGTYIDVPSFDLNEALQKDWKPEKFTIKVNEHTDTYGTSFDILRKELHTYNIKCLAHINDNNEAPYGNIIHPPETVAKENLRVLLWKLLHNLTFYRGNAPEILSVPISHRAGNVSLSSVSTVLYDRHKRVVNHEPVNTRVVIQIEGKTFTFPVKIYCRPCRDLEKILETDTFIYSLTGYSPLTTYAYHETGGLIRQEGNNVFVPALAFEMIVMHENIKIHSSNCNYTLFSCITIVSNAANDDKKLYERFIYNSIRSNCFQPYYNPLHYPIKIMEKRIVRKNGYIYKDVPHVATDNVVIALLHLCSQLTFHDAHHAISYAHAGACKIACRVNGSCHLRQMVGACEDPMRAKKQEEREKRRMAEIELKKQRAKRKREEQRIARHRQRQVVENNVIDEHIVETKETVFTPPDTETRKEKIATYLYLNKVHERLNVKRMRSYHFFTSLHDDPIVYWRRIGRVLHDKRCSGVRKVDGMQFAIKCKQCDRGAEECAHWTNITNERVKAMVQEYIHELCAEDIREIP